MVTPKGGQSWSSMTIDLLFSKRTQDEAHLRGCIPLSAGGHVKMGETAEEDIREGKEVGRGIDSS